MPTRFQWNKLLGFLLFTALLVAQSRVTRGEEMIGGLSWHTDYYTAYRQAVSEQKLLFLFFRDETQPHVTESYANDVLASPKLHESLARYVRVVLPVGIVLPAHGETPPQSLMEHKSFKYMEHRQGIAVMDLIDDSAGQYGKVISAHGFTPGKHYTLDATAVVLGLPRASVTQRALIYAVRVHPESPKSTDSDIDAHLLNETRKHSHWMAAWEQVGHLGWEQRFQELIARYDGLDVNEVAAVSWGGESLIAGAKDCVHAWRQSPGHWAGVSGVNVLYGYDLVLGASGKWYATGLFATRR